MHSMKIGRLAIQKNSYKRRQIKLMLKRVTSTCRLGLIRFDWIKFGPKSSVIKLLSKPGRRESRPSQSLLAVARLTSLN